MQNTATKVRIFWTFELIAFFTEFKMSTLQWYLLPFNVWKCYYSFHNNFFVFFRYEASLFYKLFSCVTSNQVGFKNRSTSKTKFDRFTSRIIPGLPLLIITLLLIQLWIWGRHKQRHGEWIIKFVTDDSTHSYAFKYMTCLMLILVLMTSFINNI